MVKEKNKLSFVEWKTQVDFLLREEWCLDLSELPEQDYELAYAEGYSAEEYADDMAKSIEILQELDDETSQ